MTYLALARKWRPKQFSEVVGQEHVVTALSNALNAQRVHHAYLFTGTRGVGKTTLARIFAKSLNCETGVSAEPCQQCSVCTSVDNGNYVDLLEVDAASRTGIDDMRELLDNVQYAPTSGAYKVYLIDEVHMLSKSSFNALLKTLEEPPAHVKFLFATTDPQKLPVTVLSRCLQFSLFALQPSQISKQINKILDDEQIDYEASAVDMISRAASGSMRDSLSLLEQAIAQGGGKVEESSVISMLGAVKSTYIDQILENIASNSAQETLRCTDEMAAYAVDFATALDQLLMELHHVSLAQIVPQTLEAKQLDVTKYQAQANLFTPEQIQLLYQIALIGKRDLALAPDPRAGFEMILMRMLAFTHENGGTDVVNSSNTANTSVTSSNSLTSNSPSSNISADEPVSASKESNTIAESAPAVNKPTALQSEHLNNSAAAPVPTSGVVSQSKPEAMSQPASKITPDPKPAIQQPAVISVPKSKPMADLPPSTSLATKASPEPELTDIRDLSPGKIEPQVNSNMSVPDIDVEPREQLKRGGSYQSEQGRVEPQMSAPATTSTPQNFVPSSPQPVAGVESVRQPQHNIQANSPMGQGGEDEEYQIPVEPASSSTWAGMVENLNLNGLIKEFAMNISCDDISATPMRLYLDPGYKFLHNPQREESVINEVRKIRTGDYAIEFLLEKSVAETPSERLRRKQIEKRDQTKDVLMQDQGVQGLMNTFDMSINEQSIKPK